MLDRRQLLTAIAAGLLGNVVSPRRGAAQADDIVRLNDRLSLVISGKTNVLALSAAEGLILVDSGAPDLAERLIASLRQVAKADRVSTVFNTHWHLENTGANDLLRQRGAEIVAHANTRLWMSTPTWLPAEDRYRPARPQAAQPTKTFYVDGAMDVAGEHVEYGYLIEAHTSGDIYVFFRNANVLAVGDVASPVRDPGLDYLTGAWIGGRVDALDRLVTLCDDNTRIVPGFGPVMTRAQLQAERDMMKTIYDRAADLVREGDSPEDMLDDGVLKGLPRTWNEPQAFVYSLSKGLWAHHNKLSPNVV
jgi:cyclase